MLNNQQLSNTIDSLNNKLSQRTVLIKENVINKYNFKILEESNKKILLPTDSTTFHKARAYDYALNKLRTLKSITNSNKGHCRFVLNIESSTGYVQRVVSNDLHVNSSLELIHQLRELLGDENVWVDS